MSMGSAVAVFVGAGCGALVRWALGASLNAVFPSLPPGTLAANLSGALLMGLLMGVFMQQESLSPLLRLALTTGFLGGLTTFSAFSAESADLCLRGEVRWALAHGAAHVGGSLLAVFAGIALARAFLAPTAAP